MLSRFKDSAASSLSDRIRVNEFQRRGLWGFVFALPALILFTLFAFIPILRTFRLSFFQYDLLTEPKYVGLYNFERLIEASTFYHSLVATFQYLVVTYVAVWLLALFLALALNSPLIRGTTQFRTIFFIPVVMSWVVVSVVWKLMFHQSGLVNTAVLQPLGFEPINWLTSRAAAPYAVIITSVWKELGFFMVIFLAGLQNIPQTYYDAAKVDGATYWEELWYITLPLLRPTILFSTVMGLIRGLRVLIPQLVMTGGGPVDATLVMALNIYQTAFVFLKMGRASAMAIVLFLIIGALSLVQFRLNRGRG